LAQDATVSLTKMLRETQQMSEDPSELTLVWWIPEDYWQITLSREGSMTEAGIEEMIQTVRPYTMIVVCDGRMGPFGGAVYRPESDIRASLKLLDNDGNAHSPLAEGKIDPDARNLLGAMRPVLANMLGPMGQSMHFFLFPAKDASGDPIADSRRQGAFTVKLDDRQFRWRLPLGCLLPEKTCSNCREVCSGAWNYCPWCGTKLAKTEEEPVRPASPDD
jgi:hypothetical protein